MTRLVIGFIIGLIIGWNILPQPAWAKRLWDKFMSLFHKKPSKTEDPVVVEEKP